MKRILRLLSSPAAFLISAGIMAVFLIFVLPVKSQDMAAYTPPGGGFDLGGFYTPSQAMERIQAYTPEGRAAYVYDRWTFDLAFPFAYGFFMLSAWAFGLRWLRGNSDGKNMRGIFLPLLVPLLAVCFDFVENTAVTVLMLSYPSLPYPAAIAASAGTALKWIFVSLGFVGAFALPLAGGIRSLRNNLFDRAKPVS